jgi:hypothetical protein
VGIAAVLGVSMLVHAQQPAGHLPIVGEYGAVLSCSIVLDVHSRGLTTVVDLSSIESPRVLGTIGAYFHDLARRGGLIFGVLNGMKVYTLGQPAAPAEN